MFTPYTDNASIPHREWVFANNEKLSFACLAFFSRSASLVSLFIKSDGGHHIESSHSCFPRRYLRDAWNEFVRSTTVVSAFESGEWTVTCFSFSGSKDVVCYRNCQNLYTYIITHCLYKHSPLRSRSWAPFAGWQAQSWGQFTSGQMYPCPAFNRYWHVG